MVAVAGLLWIYFVVCFFSVWWDFVFFFFKQKTAYEIMPSLVGSEMCIRDRDNPETGDTYEYRSRKDEAALARK